MVCFLFVFNLLSGQQKYSQEDSLQLNRLYEVDIKYYYKKNELKNILSTIDKAESIFRKYNDWYYIYIQHYNRIRYTKFLGTMDEYIEKINAAQAYIDTSRLDKETKKYCRNKINLSYIEYLNVYGDCINVIKEAKKILNTYHGASSLKVKDKKIILAIYNKMGNAYSAFRNHNKALDCYLKALKHLTNEHIYDEIAIYKKISFIYFQKGEEVLGLKYLLKAKNTLEALFEKNQKPFFKLNSHKLFYYSIQSKIYEALFKYNLEHNNISQYRLYFNKLQSIKDKNNNKRFQLRQILNKYLMAKSEGKQKEKIDLLLKTERLNRTTLTYNKMPINDFYKEISLYFENKGDFESALKYNQRSTQFLFLDYNNEDIFSLPKEAAQSKNNYKTFLAYAEKCKLLRLYYTSAPDKVDLIFLKEACTFALNYLNNITQIYQTREDKRILYRATTALFETTLFVDHALNASPDTILAHIEKSKSQVLLEYMQEAKAYHTSLLPDSLRNKKLQFLNIKKNLEDQKSSLTTFDSINIIQTKLSETNQSLLKLNAEIETLFPQYKKVKQTFGEYNLNDFNAYCHKEQCSIIQYFQGDNYLFVLLINEDQCTFDKIPYTPNLKSAVFDYLKSIREPPNFINNSEEQIVHKIDIYSTSAYTLYRKLIAPLTPLLKEKLLIIPDGDLAQIPFDGLLTQPIKKKAYNFKKYPYLINTYTISYAYSGNIHLKMVHNLKPKKGLNTLALAPQFGLQSPLGNLKYNEVEVQNILDILPGKSLVGAACTLDKSLSEMGHYNLIHIASHAIVDKYKNEDSYIAFAGKDSTKNKLYLKDLYDKNWSSSMVTISACETGVGKWERGEGVQSIAQGFTFAGVQSIVTSLWSVNDASTSKLMSSFYKQIKKGQPKSEALRTAKLNYIKNNKKMDTYPTYWANFILIGDTSAVQGSSSWLFYGIFAFVFFGLVMYILRRLKIF